MEMKAPLRKVIFEGKNEDDVRAEAIRNGMVTLRDAGIIKALAGVISVEEVLKKTINED